MSRSGNCLDNAPIESFFWHLKDEIDYKECKTLDEISAKIDEYMYYFLWVHFKKPNLQINQFYYKPTNVTNN